jgi:hypothetical protein
MTRIILPGATALLAVVAFIVLAGWNRTGDPLVRLTLTERELQLSHMPPRDADDAPGIQLRWDYARRDDPLDARNWLTDDRLRAIGLGLNVMPTAPEAEDTYGRALPRLAWVAFEYEGNAWREVERRRALAPAPPKRPGEPRLEASRLVPVDAAPDAATLAARYPSGHLLLRASIKLGYVPPTQKGPLVYGWIRQVIPATVHVPREFRDVLAALPSPGDAPRYDVDLVVGRLGIPYVAAVRPR